MERHNSCINTKAVIDYVEERDPSLVEPLLRDLSPELSGVADVKKFLSDPNNWVSSEVLIFLYDRLKKLFGKEDVVFDVGFESVAKKRLGYIQRIFLSAFRSYARAPNRHAHTLKRLQSLNDRFNRNKRVHVAEFKRDSAVVRLEWFKDIPLTRDFCLMNRGVYTAHPVVWNEPPCHLEEHKCYFQGDRYCEYHIRWKRKPSLKWLLLRLIAPWRLAKATIEELERDKELLRDKFAEVHALNRQLQAQLDRLLSLQDASTAILSTLDINELFTLILKRLVEVSVLDRAAIFLVDQERDELYFAHAVGADPAYLETATAYTVPLAKEANILARVARSGIPELVDDVPNSDLNKENPLIKEFKPQAFIALPLKVRGKVLGVLVCDQEKAGGQVISAEKEFLISFSNQIAIAIHNANLYRELEKSERQYRELVENAHEGIWVVDDNGVITFANQRLAAILGYEKMLGRNINQLVPSDKKRVLLKLLVQNMRGTVAQEEIQMIRREGECISAIVSSVPIMDGDRYKGSFAMVTDITEKKRMEIQILHQQKMESIGTMAGGIAHDFNNILTGVLGYASLLKHRLQDQGEVQRFIGIIESSSLRAADLVRQLLAFSRGTQPEDLQVVYPNRVIRETTRLLESSLGKEIQLELELDSAIQPIAANSTQVQQAVLNLCLNSRDAMPKGGKITISTAPVDLAEESPSIYQDLAAEPGTYTRIRVVDTGNGIPKENLDKIFDPFFTTKEVGEGSGLGLAMVYGIVQNARGHVHVETQEGKGTNFDLLFRVASGDESQQSLSELAPGLGGDETILLVDDESLVRDLGTEILLSYGYQVVQANNGQEALEVYRKNGANIDLVILDLLMPKLGGKETLIQLRELNPDVKVLICSGYGYRENDPEPSVTEDTPLVRKPFMPEKLVSAVRQLLDGETVPGVDHTDKRGLTGKVISFPGRSKASS
ncbi:MAG: PAS domain S-box protein [Deltaproteobacteria bacterium]|nr:MAG: PAS domain S-box protein [Deltaproteobacteria bacterium]